MNKTNLLDTNTAIWVSNEPNRLGKRARRLLDNANVNLVSAISIAEIEIKTSARNVELLADPLEVFARNEIDISPFDEKAALNISRFGTLLAHDPFDRLIVSQAASLNANLITSDRTLLGLGFDWIVDAQA